MVMLDGPMTIFKENAEKRSKRVYVMSSSGVFRAVIPDHGVMKSNRVRDDHN